jgi:hypothetical protein
MKTIHVPALGPILRVTTNKEEANKFVIREALLSRDELTELGDYDGCTFYHETSWNIILVLPEVLNVGVLVHEMIHVMSLIYLYIGEKVSPNKFDEMRAYIAQDIVDQIVRHLYPL